MICRLTILLLGFAALFVLSGPAQAQTTIWSATLTPKSFSNSVGCDNAQLQQSRKCSNSNRLSEDDFTDDGTSYRVRKIVGKNNGDLKFQLTAQATTATQTLTLMIGGASYALADAAHTTPSNRSTWKWSNANLSWSADTDVAVSLVAIDATATGQPRIFGAPQVGKTLTALIDDIEDGAGLPAGLSANPVEGCRRTLRTRSRCHAPRGPAPRRGGPSRSGPHHDALVNATDPRVEGNGRIL